jgi:predicted ATPase/DNA-binding SARP family transcriptional activator
LVGAQRNQGPHPQAPKTLLRVEVLGQLQARRGPQVVDLGPTKQRAVFAFLALHAGERVPIDAVLHAVWGDEAPASARNLVHTYVARLRQAVEPEMPPRARLRMIASAPSGYRLQLDSVDVDSARFHRLADQARAQRDCGDWAHALDLFGAAVRTWRDPSLADLHALLRVPHELDALRRSWLDAALAFVTIGLEHGLATVVLPMADRLAAAAPLDQEVQSRYLAVLQQTGRRPVGVDRFAGVRARVTSDLYVEHGPAPFVHDAARPPWRGVGPGVTELVGMDADLDALVDLLTHQRLVTVAGPPGCGKSAVALRTANRVRDAFTGGVVAVDLSEVADHAELVDAMLDVLDGRSSHAEPVGALADQEVLLVMDNVEHLVEACAGLVDEILRGCRYVSAIVTSREPLSLPFETVWRLRPLPVPADGQVTSRDNPAMRLFAQRAAQVVPGFRVDPDNVAAVAAICRGLDGVPLAIELAAACLATDSLDALVGKVADPLHQIQPQRRGRPAHHRSLYVALLRSVDCLTEVERRVLVRLGGLPNVFSFADAARECQRCAALDGVELRTVLSRLVDKSLLLVHHDGGGPGYRMLGMVHCLAAELRVAEPALE